MRRLPAVAIAAMLACLMAFAVSDAGATATAASSPTRAQKLSKALKACKKQPRRKRAACVKSAQRKYGTHHTAAPLPGAVTPPTGSSTAPTAPSAPAAGPAGPTLAQVQQSVCEHHSNCDATHPILNLTILERGAPRLGTGLTQQAGGDNVPSDTWIFPLLLSYDEPVQFSHYAACPPSEPFCPPTLVTETETYRWRERTKVQLDHTGAWAFFFAGSSTTCEPAIVACPGPVGGGA
jgi:hypothetical protein